MELGEGVVLSKTYAHLMAPFIMAFAPAHEGKHHPGAWKTIESGIAYDITSQLSVPVTFGKSVDDRLLALMIVVFSIRLWFDPSVIARVASTHAFADLPALGDATGHLRPLEVLPRYFSLGVQDSSLREPGMALVRDNWVATLELYKKSSAFRLAVDAMTTGQFIQNTTQTLVSLWAALEGIFSPNKEAELRFRVSSLIACYLHPAGDGRMTAQKAIMRLYDMRSSAAHGATNHGDHDLVETFNLVRSVLVKIIQTRHVPAQHELRELMFGAR
jgi:hypothetical protein